MKEMIKRVREEKGGFTLAELLIVVAILLVLIAIAVPLFTGALGRAEEAVDQANQRSARSEATTEYMLNSSTTEQATLLANGCDYYYDSKGGEVAAGSADIKYHYHVTFTKASDGTVTADAGDNLVGKTETTD